MRYSDAKMTGSVTQAASGAAIERVGVRTAGQGRPVQLSTSFDPPASKRRGDYELAVSAAGVPLVRRTVRVRRSLITRKRRRRRHRTVIRTLGQGPSRAGAGRSRPALTRQQFTEV